MTSNPAVLGGEPAFPTLLPMVRPVLPSFDELAPDTAQILASGMVTKGRHLRAFEMAVAEHLGVKHAVAVSSCTTGLMLTYRALGLHGEVVVPSFTFMATVSALIWAGLRPVFADVRLSSTNLDPDSAERALTPESSAIVAVHNFGNPAEIDALEDVARRRRVRLVFDAAHGFGATYQGVPVGRQGDAHVYSLSPTKLLVAGEGGIVATDDDALAERVRMGREYGNSGSYDSAFAGINARMPEFNALLGLHSLSHLEAAAVRRNELVALFQRELGGVPGIAFQEVAPGCRSSYKDLSLLVDAELLGLSRDELAGALAAERIDSRKYYDPPVHRQTAYRGYHSAVPLPNTDVLASGSLSLPLWSHMGDSTAHQICGAIQRISEHAPAVRAALVVRQAKTT